MCARVCVRALKRGGRIGGWRAGGIPFPGGLPRQWHSSLWLWSPRDFGALKRAPPRSGWAELAGGLGRCGTAGWTRGRSDGDGQRRGRESAPEGAEARQTATPPRAPRQAALCRGSGPVNSRRKENEDSERGADSRRRGQGVNTPRVTWDGRKTAAAEGVGPGGALGGDKATRVNHHLPSAWERTTRGRGARGQPLESETPRRLSPPARGGRRGTPAYSLLQPPGSRSHQRLH